MMGRLHLWLPATLQALILLEVLCATQVARTQFLSILNKDEALVKALVLIKTDPSLR